MPNSHSSFQTTANPKSDKSSIPAHCSAPQRSLEQHSGALVPDLPATGFLRQSQVLQFVPISKSTLWRRVQLQTFPAPLKLSARITVWRAEAIRRWIDEQATT